MSPKAIFAALAVLALAVSSRAATLFAPETFGDGGAPALNGWNPRFGGAVADAGESGVGDHVLEYSTTTNFHMNTNSSAPFLGSYTAAGATALRFRARHTGTGDGVGLRAYLFSSAGASQHGFSTGVVSIGPGDTAWQTYQVSILPADLATSGITAAALLGNVARVGLRHDPAGNGAQVQNPLGQSTQVQFDDIELIPEPSTGVLAAMAGLGLALRRRRR